VLRCGTRRLLLLAVADPTGARRRLERRLPMGLRPRPLIEDMGRSVMTNENVDLIRRAYQAYAHGDVAAMLELVDPDLEWTYLDPTLEHPTPQVCHGRHQLEQVLRGWAEHGLWAELEEVAGRGELVMVGVRTPGVDAHPVWQADERTYSVFTVREGRIVALRDCRHRQEALDLTGIG
jgi:ketosteroid isomerase-like protein